MKITVKQITTSAVLLAICIGSTFFKNASVFITGPIVNAALVIAAIYCGAVCASVIGIVTPVMSFIITGSPVMAALPVLIPLTMIGNILYVLAVCFFRDKLGKKKGLPLSIGIGSVLKAAFMGVSISLIVLPNFLPEALLPKLSVLQIQFSVTQLITALIGGVYAVLINIAVRAATKKTQEN